MPQYIGVDPGLIACSMTGTFRYESDAPPVAMPDFNVFHRYAANFPWLSHAAWFLDQMIRWGQIPGDTEVDVVARQVYRPDLYRLAAKQLGEPVPVADIKTEGTHERAWTLNAEPSEIRMGPDRWFDGTTYQSNPRLEKTR